MMGNKEGYYLYCFCQPDENDLNLCFKGLKNSDIYTINYKNIKAIGSDIDEYIIDPTKEYVFKHEEINSNIFNQTTIIPMSFGNVFKSRKDIKYLIKKLYPQLKSLLPKLKNKIELGLKIFWSPEEIIGEIADDNPQIQKHPETDLID